MHSLSIEQSVISPVQDDREAYCTSLGLLVCHGVACSYAWAILNKVPSPLGKAPICNPTGMLLSSKPQGTEMAGQFAKLKIRVNRNLRRDEDSLLEIGGSSMIGWADLPAVGSTNASY